MPKTKKETTEEIVHGIPIPDPYRWLENADDPTVRAWIQEQNTYTDLVLRNDAFKVFSDELIAHFKTISFSNPIPRKGRYFYKERQPDEDQFVLYVKNGLDSAPVKLVDPNGLRPGNTTSIRYWSPSQSGKYIAYGLDEGGNEMATLYIKDVDTNKNLGDTIAYCRHRNIQWLPDDSAFYYVRNPRPGTVPKNEEHLHSKVYFHKLGDNADNDELIFGDGRPKDDMIDLSLSVDGRYLGIEASQNWTENNVYVYDGGTRKLVPIVMDIAATFDLRFLRDRAILITNYKANNYRLLSVPFADVFKPIDRWEEYIPEREHVIQCVRFTKSKILIEYLINACSEVVEFDYSGKETGKIPLPPYSSITGISTNRDEEEFFYAIDAFTFPNIVYRFDPRGKEYVVYKKTDNPIKPEDYSVRQEWFVSKDGTKIPLFVFHKNSVTLNGTNPTLLYGYGGFGNNETPGFVRVWVPWLERGGVFAVANIRGGGEFGETWHKDGMREKKQNSFDDFIAAGEYLINQKYTDVDHLGVVGGSNGGLLVSAVAIERPELFKAVCSRVPLTDMVRFPKFGMAIRWIHEYGNPEIKSDLERILKWSPYHNVKTGVNYPSFFFTTADKDTRVDPLHARKMTAALQGIQKATYTGHTLIFNETDAGHGSGKPIRKIIECQALILSFFSGELGLRVR